jgi:probable selenium-dependent hydroxylase accessory protein YqeC
MWLPGLPLVLSDSRADLNAQLQPAFGHHQVIAAGSGAQGGKLIGLEPGTVCSISAPDVTLCEADGAAGRSLKIHRSGEPVVPACTTHFIVVTGLDALGRRFGDAAHPAALGAEYFGVRPDTLIHWEHLAGALLEGAGFRPPQARLLFLLNKADSPVRLDAALRVSRHLHTSAPDAVVLFVSRGQVIDVLSPPAR